MAATTWSHSHDFRSEEALWTFAIKQNPASPAVQTNYAKALLDAGKSYGMPYLDDLNVPVFILRRSHRRTGVVVVADEDIGVSHGVGSCLPGSE